MKITLTQDDGSAVDFVRADSFSPLTVSEVDVVTSDGNVTKIFAPTVVTPPIDEVPPVEVAPVDGAPAV